MGMCYSLWEFFDALDYEDGMWQSKLFELIHAISTKFHKLTICGVLT